MCSFPGGRRGRPLQRQGYEGGGGGQPLRFQTVQVLIGVVLCAATSNMELHHICMGRTEAMSVSHPLHIYEPSLFHIPISHVRGSLTRATRAVTNCIVPILLGIRRRGGGGMAVCGGA